MIGRIERCALSFFGEKQVRLFTHKDDRVTVGGRDLSGRGVQCIRCNRVELYTAKIATTKGVPHSMLMKKFTLQGWVYRSKGWECPDCIAKDKVARKAGGGVAMTAPPRAIIPVANRLNGGGGGDGGSSLITGATTITGIMADHIVFAPGTITQITTKEKPVPIESPLDAREAAIAKMTPPDRRRIFREVDDNWNEPKGRYLGAVSDRTIAEKLKVPPVWVETVRRESFGDSADNDEIERLQGEIAKLEGTVQLQIDAALKVAASLETILKEVRGLSDRLQMVEKAVGLKR